MGVGGSAAAGGVLAAELCAPLLLLCWLCCWPDAASEGARRASGLGGRTAGSAASLHLPGPSGGSPARSTGSTVLPLHRSHEELSHSAPGVSVLREVLLRRDWDRSARDLYIPLRPEALSPAPAPAAPRATPDTPPADEDTPRCKKHHSNIKSSRRKEQRAAPEERDEESPSRFYIGDDADSDRVKEKPLPPEKEEKQCLNESIRSKERSWRLSGTPDELSPDSWAAPDRLAADSWAAPDRLAAPDSWAAPDGLAPDRSGAVHHALASRAAPGSTRAATLSPISVDVVGYESLTDESPSTCGERRDRCAALPAAAPAAARARHASDGDILAPAPRPESGAFSESDLDLELRLALQAEEEQGRAAAGRAARGEERPARDVRETAI